MNKRESSGFIQKFKESKKIWTNSYAEYSFAAYGKKQVTLKLLNKEDGLFSKQRLRLWGIAFVIIAIIALSKSVIDIWTRYSFIDFIWLWTGGQFALTGQAASAYDYHAFSAAQAPMVAATKGIFPYYHWLYPPTLFFLVAPLAMMPYLAAYLFWVASTLYLYLLTIYVILPKRLAVVLALVPMAVFPNIALGHIGFLSTALIGLSVAFIHRRPYLAGLFLGLLTLKPHFGLIFPFVLIAAGHWRVIASAVITCSVISFAAAIAFGADTWLLFLESLTSYRNVYLMPDAALRAVLQSPYGLAIWLGVPPLPAWGVHFAVAITSTILICRFQRREVSESLKAAIVSAGVLMVTPYALFYDLLIPVLPAVFLLRDALTSGFLPGERMLLFGCFVAAFIPVWPAGPVVSLLLMFLVLRRAKHRCRMR